MKYNWSSVVNEFRKIVVENVKVRGKNSCGYSLATFVFETDRFHPFDTDGLLSGALNKIPARCDYRNLKSYWAWKDGRILVEDALDEMLLEVENLIVDFYEDSWNFPPGYVKPDSIEIGWKNKNVSAFSRIIKAAKRA